MTTIGLPTKYATSSHFYRGLKPSLIARRASRPVAGLLGPGRKWPDDLTPKTRGEISPEPTSDTIPAPMCTAIPVRSLPHEFAFRVSARNITLDVGERQPTQMG